MWGGWGRWNLKIDLNIEKYKIMSLEIVEPCSDLLQAFLLFSPFPLEKPDTQAKFNPAIQR